jgi:hypothetical protein
MDEQLLAHLVQDALDYPICCLQTPRPAPRHHAP